MSNTAPRSGQSRLSAGLLAAAMILGPYGCGKAPTAHEAMRDCYVQLNTQSPDWRKYLSLRNSKMGVLVARYMGACMQEQRFKLAASCTTMDERCYTREPHFWERL